MTPDWDGIDVLAAGGIISPRRTLCDYAFLALVM